MTAPGYGLVFLVSAGILAFEIFLMGLFALVQWHHFASLILSVALLGFGLSGTILALWREWFVARIAKVRIACAVVFVVTLGAAIFTVPLVPFVPFRVLWDGRQLLFLLVYYLVLMLPFTSGATVVGLAFLDPHAEIPTVYSANLLGSGLGVFAGLLVGFIPMNVPLSEYKSLSKALLLPQATVVQRTPHPLGRVDVVTAPALRVAPGLSLAYHGPMPRQEALFVNGDGPSALLLSDPHAEDSAFLEWLPNALPYEVLENPKVLVVGAGGGLDVRQAIRLTRSPVTALEPHPAVAGYVRERIGLELEVREARGFLQATDDSFDLIQISLVESFGAASAGSHSLHESYLYTVEAFTDALSRLNENGMLAITRWLKTPPRDEIRLFATAVRALESIGAPQPREHLLFVRGLQNGTLLVKRSSFQAGEIERTRRFCDERLFDLDYFPGITVSDSNRYNRVSDNPYFVAFQEILAGDRERFVRDYLFDVRPVTDDRPFFFQFFRWRHAQDLWQLFKRQALPLVEWSYLVSLATLGQALMASVVLIGLPLVVKRREVRSVAGKLPVFTYFAALGLGFMLIEMALLQKFVLFLAHPIYSASVVIASFLVFAGLGSVVAERGTPHVVLFSIIIIGGLELVVLPGLFGFLPAANTVIKVIFVITAIAPLAFLMGMPFALGLGRISTRANPLVAWAWGINGCCSVVAASLAPLLAIHLGFTVVTGLGLGCYAVAALVSGRTPLRG